MRSAVHASFTSSLSAVISASFARDSAVGRCDGSGTQSLLALGMTRGRAGGHLKKPYAPEADRA